MKITIIKENLKKAIGSVERATGSGSVLPILKNILVKTEDNRIRISATDLEMGINYFINGKIEEEGGITIPSSVLGSVLNNISESKLSITTEGQKIKINTGNSFNTISGLKESDFPIIPKVEADDSIEIKSAYLKAALINTSIAAAPTGRRPELNGVLFWIEGGEFRITATDGFRLAEKIIKSDQFKSNIDSLRVIIPLKTIQEVIKLLDISSNVKIFVNNHQILFDFGDAELVSRIVEGNFPEYKERIPENHQTSTTINRDELIDAVKLASVFVGKINDIKLRSDSDDGLIEVSGNDAVIGENVSKIKVGVSGDNQNLVLNWRYLLDGLRIIDDKELSIGLNGESEPVVIRSPKDNSYFYMVMPIRSGS